MDLSTLRNVSKIFLAQRGEPRSYEQQRATGEKRGVYVGIAFRVSFVTPSEDRASIISGLGIKCFNIGKKRKTTPLRSRIIWEHVGFLP